MQGSHDQEVRLYADLREKQYVEDCANLFALLKTLQSVESAFSRGRLDAEAYERCCTSLLTQWNNAYDSTLKEKVGPLEKFAETFNIRAERAIRRIADGQPATAAARKVDQNERGLIVDCVQQSATLESCLTMGMPIKDIIPYLRGFLSTVAKLPAKPRPENVAKMRAWLEHTEGLGPYAHLKEEERDQMRLDLERLIADISNC